MRWTADDDRAADLARWRHLFQRDAEAEAAEPWAVQFRGWAATLRDQERIAPPGGWTGNDYLELCDVMAAQLERWAAEMERNQ